MQVVYHAAAETMPTSAQEVFFDTDSGPLRVDNCATRSISPFTSDFITTLLPAPNIKVQGIGGVIEEVLTGTIQWKIEDDEGGIHKVILPESLYIPSAPSRLLSPQHWAQTVKDNKPHTDGTWCATYGKKVVLYWNQMKHKRTIDLDINGSNVASIRTAPGYTKSLAFMAATGMDSEGDEPEFVTYDANMISDDEGEDEQSQDSQGSDEDNFYDANSEAPEPEDAPFQREGPLFTTFDLNGNTAARLRPAIITDEEDTMPQDASAEFLRWHHRLGHISSKKIRILATQGILPKRLANCRVPICTSCLFGKATRRPWRTKATPGQAGRTRTITAPGECVSIDQLVSTTPGLVAQLRGIPTTIRYKVATVFVDHFSKLGYVHLQKSTGAVETIAAKEAFERFAASHGVQVLHYHADNGIFTDNAFTAAVKASGQQISFCGVNAHFQNGVAERKIRDLTEHARTMLIHANSRWPSAITTNLWPYALRSANDIINATPQLSARHDGGEPSSTPLSIFTRSPVPTNPQNWYPFGCPVFVLESKLASGGKIDKWTERARIGVNLGHSAAHASNVTLVLSLTTGLASPQFHTRMDPTFQTLRKVYDGRAPASLWQSKCHFTKDQGSVPDKAINRSTTWWDSVTNAGPRDRDEARSAHHGQAPVRNPPEGGAVPNRGAPDQEDASVRSSTGTPRGDDSDRSAGSQDPDNQSIEAELLGTLFDPITNQRRSARLASVDERMAEAFVASIATPTQDHTVAYEALSMPVEPLEQHPLLAYAASADPDTMYMHQAMREPDRQEFIKAMAKEVETRANNWTITHKSQVPEGATVLPAVWAMKRKRRIATNEVYKWKARLNIDGSKQVKGVNYWETYAPVASWPTIRTILMLVIAKGWYTRQIDYVLAYTQADVELDNLYMHIPKGFEVPDGHNKNYVLKINRNVYGQKQAGRVWNEHLIVRLKQVGFKQSLADPCVFYRGSCIYVIYTDDSILAGPDSDELDAVTQEMQDAGLEITVDGDICDFLGVQITNLPDGTVSLTQPRLIDQILKDMRLDHKGVTPKQTPAPISQILTKHTKSESFDGHFKYRSIIGKMGYLEKSTRPDIAQALHQCARYSADPKVEHGKALTWLGRYLAGTRDKGIIYNPMEQSFECHVDADFAGNWDRQEAPDDPDTARSRSGYVITYAGCPLLWASKLQTQIALSTTEAEYIALSTALRDTIPLMELIKEMREHGFDITQTKPQFHCRVFEDNSGALEIASVHKFRPRTKHINNQYHHFRSYVTDGLISIIQVASADQRADILTKSVSLLLLLKHRFTIMGW